MMDDTPRAFVGRASFSVAGMRSASRVRAVLHELLATPGVTDVIADAVTGSVSLTVDGPVDRSDVAAAVSRAGHRIGSA
jgi:copper chaperone CopZ